MVGGDGAGRRGGAGRARWFRIDDAIVHAAASSADGSRLRDVRIFRRDGRGRLETRLAAEEAVFREGAWRLGGVEATRYASGSISSARTASQTWRTSLRPEDLAAFFAETPVLSAAAARRSLVQAAPVDVGEAVLGTRVHRSAAEPLAPLVMLLFALPIAFVAPRTGRAWPALLYGGGAGLVYLVGDGVLTVAAQTGYVPSVLGAWAAPVLALLIGLTVLVQSER